MSATAAAPAMACGILVLSIVVALVLIPVLDAELRRAEARRGAARSTINDEAPALNGTEGSSR